MQGNFKVISLSFKSAPVEIREVIALEDDLMKILIKDFQDLLGLSDILILSTCNRTEVYYSHEKDKSNEIIKLLGIKNGIKDILQYQSYFDIKNESRAAAQHLFRVSLGLEAQVVGDLQIINQVKRAYQLSADGQAAGPFLHRILHTIFFANKRVFQETNFRNGAASVSYASAELVRNVSQNINDPKILVFGLGEIGIDVAKYLAQDNKHVSVTNRTLEKAIELGSELNLDVVPFENALQQLNKFDVIISSVPVKHIIGTEEIEGNKDHGLKFLIDLSIPRSIDPEVEKLSGVALYNIDEIQNNASAAVQKRLAAVPKVESIIEDSLADLKDWTMEMEVSPTIQKLKGALEEIRQDELKRHLKNASPEMEALADKLSKSLTQKIMKLPVLQLKAACKRGEADTLIDILNDLFDLEKQPINK